MERFLYISPIRSSVIFLVIFFFVLPIGRVAFASYSCVNDNGRKLVFSYSNGINIDHMSFSPKPPVGWFSTSYKENLSSDSDGGSYNIKITNEYARVIYIQDTVKTFMEIPGGVIVKEENSGLLFEKLYRGEYQTITRLHGIFPVLTTFQLDLKTKTLVNTGKFLDKPRKIKKIKFNTNNRNESGRIIPIKEPMSEVEGNQIFKDYLNKDQYKTVYKCEEINPFSGGFLHWLKTMLFP